MGMSCSFTAVISCAMASAETIAAAISIPHKLKNFTDLRRSSWQKGSGQLALGLCCHPTPCFAGFFLQLAVSTSLVGAMKSGAGPPRYGANRLRFFRCRDWVGLRH